MERPGVSGTPCAPRGPNSSSIRIDDFSGNNFDHTGVGFIRGAAIGTSGDGAPVQRFDNTPPGMRRWGKDYKDFLARYYTRSWELNMTVETMALPSKNSEPL